MDTEAADSFYSPEELWYASAYSAAALILERAKIGPNAPGRDRAKELDRLRMQVRAEVKVTGDPQIAEAVEAGITVAIEGRKPRY